ncbi:MAG: tRNA pseudouridine(38-40) synthase TruA [Bacteroidetes bacterium]|nr:tRNA pseudouridine(38-40) synthase TruA [Bacteroidota bacterium]
MRYFFHIGYNGYNYHGWQKHAPHLTIQEVLEVNIGKLLKAPVTILGCGRTDAQVHASQYFFHLDSEKELSDEIGFLLNKMLPEDIAVFDITQVNDNSHARFDATQRTYNYFIHTYKDPFLNHFSCLFLKKLDIDKIKQALYLLTKYNDYRAFCKSPEKNENTICNITSAELFSDSKRDKLRIQISSNRFLRGMVRAIVAKLLKTGTGEMSVDEFENHLISKSAASNLEFASPHGLYLSRVVYPFLDIPPRTDLSPLHQNNEQKKWQLP